ncbi:hypothetical protein [Halopiger djelfimassiliensis]|uniref:hypothetical protein n=1 Tax=Halopiger djelfimassiliensis TaxID=1293047 RepID=UPI000AD60988|nr:hypothetical protein [Halopiger djelfimassiliensis]
MPDVIAVDRMLPSTGAIGHALESYAAEAVGPDADLTRLHRVYYPVFRVEYRYEQDSRIPWGNDTSHAVTLLDGLWADNHAALQQYRSGTDAVESISLEPYDFGRDGPGLGRTVLLDFQVPTQRARRLLPERLADVTESRRIDDPDSITSSFVEELTETFGLPPAFEPEGFDGVVNVSRLYLPFWVCEVTRSDERDLIGAVRDIADVGDGDSGHEWLSAFFREDRSRLARYAHASIRRSGADAGGTDSSERRGSTTHEGDAGSDPETPPERSTEGENTEREPTDADQPLDATGTGAERTGPVQPEDVDLDAGSLVEPSPNRCFADVGGMERIYFHYSTIV